MNAQLSEPATTHTVKKPFTCVVCKQSFSTKKTLTYHHRRHTGEKPYECNVCQKSFARKETLDIHTHTHTGEKPHVCDVCGKSFIVKYYLKKHLSTHTGENKRFSCDKCSSTFYSQYDLNRHLASHTKPFTCSYCPQSFYVKYALKKHLIKHTTRPMKIYEKIVPNIVFDYCVNKRYFSSTQFIVKKKISNQDDLKQNDGKSSEQIQGDMQHEQLQDHTKTDKRNLNDSEVYNQIQDKLESDERMPDNPEQDEQMPDNLEQDEQMPDNPEQDKQMNEIPEQDEQSQFDTKSLKQNLQHDKSNVKKDLHMCNICEKSFSTKTSLMKHCLIHGGEKSFVCDICGKRFLRKGNLNAHRLVHFDERMFACEKCGKKFRHKFNLDRHFRRQICEKSLNQNDPKLAEKNQGDSVISFVIHEQDQNTQNLNEKKNDDLKEKKSDNTRNGEESRFDSKFVKKKRSNSKQDPTLHLCNVCEKSYSTKSNLNKHLLIHIGNKSFVCETCGKGFLRKGNLDAHLRVHSDVKNFACDKCGKTFRFKFNLDRHFLGHFGVKPYKCNDCPMSFWQKAGLQEHICSNSEKKQNYDDELTAATEWITFIQSSVEVI